MRILDMTSGNRAVWFNKNHPDCLYLDIRPEMNPTKVHDIRERIPGGELYDLIVFDPPHITVGKNSNMAKFYGQHTKKEILELVEKGSANAAEAASVDALMAFKWNDHDIKLDQALALMTHWEPLFGHHMRNRGGPAAKSQTYWVMLRLK